jgi:hypothetical protein
VAHATAARTSGSRAARACGDSRLAEISPSVARTRSSMGGMKGAVNQTPVVNSDWRRNASTAATRRCTCGSSDRPMEKMALAYFSGEGEVVEHGSHPELMPATASTPSYSTCRRRLPGRRPARQPAPAGRGQASSTDARPGG